MDCPLYPIKSISRYTTIGSTLEIGSGRVKGQGHPCLYRELDTWVGYMRPCFKNQTTKAVCVEGGVGQSVALIRSIKR